MSGKDRRDWEAMLRADPALQAAWNGYLAQLERDAALVVQGVQPTGHATADAARQVIAQAGKPVGVNDN